MMADEQVARNVFLGLDHAQVTAPRGAEDQARAFYGAVLGMPEVAKPDALAGRGGAWFQVGEQQLHIGVEDDFQPQRKAHPAFRVRDLATIRARLEAAGAPISEDVPLPGRLRFETRDPFGNRLEFQQLFSDTPAASVLTTISAANVPTDDEVIRQRVREQFGAYAQNYVTSVSHVSGADLERLVELATPTATDYALDVSTGGGHVALALAPHVARVVASDLTPAMLVEARAFLTAQGATNADYVIADAGALPFIDATFDLVTVRTAPHHYPDVACATREMARVLKPGGRLVIVDNIAPADPALDALLDDWERRRDPSHVRSYTVQEWRGFLAAAGLRVTHEEVGRKDLAYQPWAERIGMAPDDVTKLAADMLVAPEAARAYFAITERNGQLVQWTMEYAIFRAER